MGKGINNMSKMDWAVWLIITFTMSIAIVAVCNLFGINASIVIGMTGYSISVLCLMLLSK